MTHARGPNAGIGGMFQQFVHSETAGSVILLACTIAALGLANSPWGDAYFRLVHAKIAISFGDAKFALSVQHWINDGLMVLFFFVVGLEIKRELLVGQLSSFRNALLPVMAAAGGMLVPAAIYASLNAGGPGARGWGVPMATDIAFALGILALFGRRVPAGLKVFLTALAIADDLGAVLVIAIFYTETLRWGALLLTGVALALILAASRAGVRRTSIYIVLGVAVWTCVLASGVHATVAGILVAMLVPVRPRREPTQVLDASEARIHALRRARLTPDAMVEDRAHLDTAVDLHQTIGEMLPPGLMLEKVLHPTQSFLILPLFAFFNAGVRIDGHIGESLAHPVSLGIIAGLVAGKQLGIAIFSWLAVRLGGASLPTRVTWSHIYGIACVAGVGFTMSLFIAELGLADSDLIAHAKIGILTASLLSAVWGYAVLSLRLKSR
jgi:NhaA family Na+:H+ antiporter